jgi:hypothetical protein
MFFYRPVQIHYLKTQDFCIACPCPAGETENTTLCVSAVAQWLRCCATNRKVARSIPAGVSGFFIDIKSFRSHYGSGVDSAPNRNEYQEYFLGVKAAGT